MRYTTKGAKSWETNKRNRKPRNEYDVVSDSESDEDDTSGQKEWAWDAKQLELIQMDDLTVKREYTLIHVQRTEKYDDNLKIMLN